MRKLGKSTRHGVNQVRASESPIPIAPYPQRGPRVPQSLLRLSVF